MMLLSRSLLRPTSLSIGPSTSRRLALFTSSNSNRRLKSDATTTPPPPSSSPPRPPPIKPHPPLPSPPTPTHRISSNNSGGGIVRRRKGYLSGPRSSKRPPLRSSLSIHSISSLSSNSSLLGPNRYGGRFGSRTGPLPIHPRMSQNNRRLMKYILQRSNPGYNSSTVKWRRKWREGRKGKVGESGSGVKGPWGTGVGLERVRRWQKIEARRVRRASKSGKKVAAAAEVQKQVEQTPTATPPIINRVPRLPRPTPQVPLEPPLKLMKPGKAQMYKPRLMSHWENTLSGDLLGLVYNHQGWERVEEQITKYGPSLVDPRNRVKGWKGGVEEIFDQEEKKGLGGEGEGEDKILNPYTVNRPRPKQLNNRSLIPLPSFRPRLTSTSTTTSSQSNGIASSSSTPTSQSGHHPLLPDPLLLTPPPSSLPTPQIPTLKAIHIEAMVSMTNHSKEHIVGLMWQLASMTGLETKEIEVAKTGKRSSTFKIRANQSTGAHCTLKGPQMYLFLQTLLETVFPRLKSFNGLLLPAPSHPSHSPSSTSGVVSFGLSPQAIALMPQMEGNLDAWTGGGGVVGMGSGGVRGRGGGGGRGVVGVNVHCVTNARGRKAQDQARALLSGWRMPFIRRG